MNADMVINEIKRIYDTALIELMKASIPIYLTFTKDDIKGISAECCQKVYRLLQEGEAALFIIDGISDGNYEYKAVTVADCRDLMSGIIKQYELPRLLMNATIIFKPLRESKES